MMQIRVGYELIYDCPQPTPMMLMLNIHHTRADDIIVPGHLVSDPTIPVAEASRKGGVMLGLDTQTPEP